jgi:1,4-dihydroxy-2-naphthoate octaprenyltransferase
VDWRGGIVAFGVASVLAFQRTLALDVRAVRTDQLVGRETLAHALGPRTAERVFLTQLLLFAAILGLLGLVAGWATSYCVPMLLGVPYALFYAAVLRHPLRGQWAEIVVDGQFFVLAAASLAWGLLRAV